MRSSANAARSCARHRSSKPGARSFTATELDSDEPDRNHAGFPQGPNWDDLELGRPFSEREILSGTKVCLLGKTACSRVVWYPRTRSARKFA